MSSSAQNSVENPVENPTASTNDADAFFHRGNAYIPLQQFDKALENYEQALAIQPKHAQALSNRGNIFIIQERFEQALDSFDQALAIQPNYADALGNRGTTLLRLQRFEEALVSFDQAVALQVKHAGIFFNRGNVLLALNRFEDALDSYDQALAIQPDYADALSNRGAAFIKLRRLEDALLSIEQALVIQPNHADALSKRGTILGKLNRFEEAQASLAQALAIQPHSAEALSNYGAVLIKLNRFEEAIASLEQALAIQPNYADALYNYGTALNKINRFEEAIVSLKQASTINPDHADAHWNEALCRLSLGDFALGWQKHEWRWQAESLMAIQRNFAQPLWLGQESLRNKTILLYAEQGLGDTIQFCRYVPKVAALGATVILEVQPALQTLLHNLAGVTRIIAQGETLPPFDVHCPLLSLPLAFGTDLDSIPFAHAATTPNFINNILLRGKRLLSSFTNTSSAPASTEYYLSTNVLHKTRWKNKLGLANQTSPHISPRIGLTWNGNPTHDNDHNRSIPLHDFMGIIDVQNEGQKQAQFYCLQKELRKNDQDLIYKQNNIAFVGNDLKDFSDTAALIDLMDLVITVDTSIAHLAGAMGKPVWILLPFNADWRWLTKRNDSPWYPSARLFRQPKMGDWRSVIANIKQELIKL